MLRMLAFLLVAAALPAWSQTDLSAPNEPVGHRFLIEPGDLPPPFATDSVAEGRSFAPIPDPPVLNLPEGFTVNLFAGGFDNARWLAVAPGGDVFLAETREGTLHVLRDGDGDGVAETISQYWDGLDGPTGMVFGEGALYVADLEGIWRFPYAEGDLEASGRPERITAQGAFGGTRGHWTRTLARAPDGGFYVGIGSRDNLAIEDEPRATIRYFAADGSGGQTFAAGLRNPVGIAVHPETGALYTVVNERDGYGDDLVPDYFTRVRQGEFFGWPYAYAGGVPYPEYGQDEPDLVAATVLPDVLIQSHSAPLGLVFYDGEQFPAEYRGDAFVSLHGSWNRSQPTGYKIVRIRFEDGRPVGGYENFATGFWFAGEREAQLYGRPVGLAVAADSALLIADDGAQVVWRIAWQGE
ncbi:MAG: PQQ-dependent sugar dehydrogenase [Proteobacteria bacterium]|nr:PQQ-dependent sugar dehydrogenase [Pseudomonadota bacterium]